MKYDQEKLLATYAEVKSVKKVAKIFKCSTGTVMNYIDPVQKKWSRAIFVRPRSR